MSETAKLTGPACRAARGLLNWTQSDLVREAGVSYSTVVKLEKGEPIRADAAARIAGAFTVRGVELLNGDSPGARMPL